MDIIISREEYIKYLDNIIPGLGKPGNGCWVPEQSNPVGPSYWFVCCKPIANIRNGCFWDDCYANMQGHLKCYSSSDDEQAEWWGFTEKDDAIWFMLRWSQ
jgi:hypothetical protein